MRSVNNLRPVAATAAVAAVLVHGLLQQSRPVGFMPRPTLQMSEIRAKALKIFTLRSTCLEERSNSPCQNAPQNHDHAFGH